MLINKKLKDYHIILASGSPRRQKFFKDLGLDFEIRLKKVDEVYPERLYKFEIPDYLAQLKALPHKEGLKENDILITSDTIVWHNNQALGKPKSKDEATAMLTSQSGTMHEVITSVCFTTTKLEKTVNHTTKVYFKQLTDEEIEYYVTHYQPYDKAGAYGIQEWIGQIGIEKIEGSYFNVVGLPVFEVYKTLNSLID
ncbi:Maf family nucleotide pyrophosphatase [Galbibacter pacificus]|uniref:dTTP/UTP pyrophosphatase n=1 Tax=Galbibacter pacificus TaxID=2996052 RepID=A0ABT6FQW4_9FLAO|nr:Maf family nucleotide pyrophosphatase [Galbibacter pacificus]MDG3581867.1 Maf family nucleotide pyrophosphatase [Galbibacter pacificus]MDG3585659.1 Maf family nucleotide pyrophosphatase [Galbibacter pacificus]